MTTLASQKQQGVRERKPGCSAVLLRGFFSFLSFCYRAILSRLWLHRGNGVTHHLHISLLEGKNEPAPFLPSH